MQCINYVVSVAVKNCFLELVTFKKIFIFSYLLVTEIDLPKESLAI